MSKKSEAVKLWRKNTKNRIVESMGGKCTCCGYSRCTDALALHHLDPSEKELGFGGIRANPKSWETLVEELRKCILVCHVCHSEIHAGIRSVEVKQYFNEDFIDYRSKKSEVDLCPVCNSEKLKYNKTCSHGCAAKLSGKVDWNNIDLLTLKDSMSFVAIADMLGVTDAAVRKRFKKIIPR